MFFYLYHSLYYFFFFFSSRRRHTRLQGDWSSDVCSSDLAGVEHGALGQRVLGAQRQHVVGIAVQPLACIAGLERGRPDAVGGAQRDHARLRSEEHTSELQSPCNLVCRLLLEKKKRT